MEEVEFNPEKDANAAERGPPMRFAALLFEGRYIEEEDQRQDYGETRFIATGPIAELGDRLHVAVYT